MAQPTKAEAIKRLQRVLDAIPELKNLRRGSPEFEKWRRDTKVAITNAFGNESDNIKDFNKINYSVPFFVSRMPDSYFQNAYVRGIESAAAVLKSMINEVEEYWPEENQPPATSEVHKNERINTNEIFIVHGRDEGAKETVARFLDMLDLVPVTLAEKPGKDLTIIEKFEQPTHVGFAIVLLTPDDAGSLQDDENDLSPRARQNVIFELGFFIGRLGREHVCALTKGDVEIPSNYAGIEYVPLDASGGWKQKLFRELRSVGFQVDANQVF